MAKKWGAHWLWTRREHWHEGWPQPHHQAGAAVRLRELHLHGGQHRGEAEEPVGHCGSLWWEQAKGQEWAREDGKQGRRGICSVLTLSALGTERLGTSHSRPVRCLSRSAAENTFTWLLRCFALLSNIGLQWGSQWHFQSLSFKKKVILKVVYFLPLCLYLKRTELDNFCFPPFPNPASTPHISPRPAVGSFSPGTWNPPKTNITICWISLVLNKRGSRLLKSRHSNS